MKKKIKYLLEYITEKTLVLVISALLVAITKVFIFEQLFHFQFIF